MGSRRRFLKHAATATAATLLTRIPERRLWAATPADVLPDSDEALLRRLALAAVDAARAAGAVFADVRISAGRSVGIDCEFDRQRMARPVMKPPSMQLVAGYGIRAIVDGAWGFATGYELTTDAVTAVARAAVARARANRPRRPRTLELAPVPAVESGRWATPIAQDPFAVPIGVQGDLALATLASAAAVPQVVGAAVGLGWQRTERVFASSEGSLLLQRVDLALPSASVVASAGNRYSYVSETVGALRQGGYGYEAVTDVNLAEELQRAAERAVAGSRTLGSPVSAEVGRYDLVFSADAVAKLLGLTVAEAVNAERALGYEANQSGTSFLAPPAEVLGNYRLGSRLLTVRADRTRPHGAATIGWDDEGVPTEEFPFIQDGVLVDYCTTRQTGAELAASYRARGKPVRSHGCASGAGQEHPTVQLPNLTLEPAKGEASVADLIASTKRGVYIDMCWGSSDQQVVNSQFVTSFSGARAIRNGKLGERLEDLAFQFLTPQLWKSVDALGGPGSSKVGLQPTDYEDVNDAIQLPYASVSAVPMRVRDVNVLNVGRTA